MKFYLGDGVEVELTPEIAKSIVIINETSFKYGENMYTIHPVEFRIDDIYFLLYKMVKDNPDKKIFVHHFEQLANDFYAMYFALEV